MKMNMIDVFSYYNSKLNVYAYYPRWLLYYSHDEQTNSALDTSDIKLIYTKYSIRTVVINRGEFFYSTLNQKRWFCVSILLEMSI